MASIDNFSKLCVHTQTTKPWTIEECISHFSAAGIKGISIWRHLLEGKDLKSIKAMLDAHQMEVVSLVRGGFFPAVDAEQRDLALEDNRLAIDQAATLGAPLVVLVCGADPRQSLEISLQQIQKGITALIPHAQNNGVKLAIEPLHPMYAGDKSALVSLGQANDMCEAIASPWVGIAIDVYHLWWDNELKNEIIRCGKNKNILAFHVCDWRVPTINTPDPACSIQNGDVSYGTGCETGEFSSLYNMAIASNVFSNLQTGYYWSETPTGNSFFTYRLSIGHQGFAGTAANYAWAVHDGDIGASAVPLPAGNFLFLSGLVGIILMRGRNA